ncbi:HAD-IIIA family hydrolase [Cohnella faecalis]|uniref:HAD-IIIA family hydrolase n=1 Tax=Cohnella faecalis TaxID=2315694 RepID=A0A398CT97_9BACL|nr:HAD-IIIA family hydrolase [Cohnella faecalis]RIE03988.1 HAD-IIIA family hydrolase [Cohnella faecalis]
MKAVIMAGGKGTRLSEFTKEIPKPLIPIGGKPVLEHQIRLFVRYGIRDILIVTGHLGERIEQYFEDGASFGAKIEYFREERPLGTAGALAFLKERLTDSFLLVYGDVLFDMDLERFAAFHRSQGTVGTLTVHPNNHPYDSDVLKVNAAGRVERIFRKNEKRDFDYSNCVNAGVYAFEPELLETIADNAKQDLEKDVLAALIGEGRISAYRTTEYMKDMGTPDRYALVQRHLEDGIVSAKNLSSKQKAIFLDRDGTLNKYVGLVSSPEQLEIEDGVVEALKLANDSAYLAIVVTNQPVVARNLCTEKELGLIHDRLETRLGERGVYVDDIVYCPHHPDKGYPEENVKYKIPCDCRKPSIGMLTQAAEKYNIDLAQSFLIGDTTVDLETGRNAGVTTVLVATGLGGTDGRYSVVPDYEADDLLEAVNGIISGKVLSRSRNANAELCK